MLNESSDCLFVCVHLDSDVPDQVSMLPGLACLSPSH